MDCNTLFTTYTDLKPKPVPISKFLLNKKGDATMTIYLLELHGLSNSILKFLVIKSTFNTMEQHMP